VVDRELVCVVWHQGDRIDVTDAAGGIRRILGSKAVALAYAVDAGLSRVPTSDDVARWERYPDPR
jgi:hypothetical protein